MMLNSVLKIFYRPREAMTEIIANPPPLAVVAAFYLFITTIVVLLAPLPKTDPAKLQRALAVLPLLAHPRLFSFVIAVAMAPVFALLLHGAAKLVGGLGSLRNLFILLLLINAVFVLPSLAAQKIALLRWGLFFWQLALSCVAVSVVHQFTIGRSIASYIVAMVGLVVLLIGSCTALIFRGGFQEKLLQPPALTRSDTPADYAWSMNSIDGQTLNMESLRGQVVVLNRWATWCGPCRTEMSSLQRLHDQVKGENIRIVTLSDEAADKVKNYLNAKKYTLPAYVAKTFPSQFAPTSIPATYILSPKGMLVSTHQGAARWDDPKVIEFLRALLKE
jgi:thiol-disulfide isomerase/thioredoxin